MLQCMESQRAGHDWVTNWTELMGVLRPGPLRSMKPYVHTPQQFWGSPSIHHVGWWLRQGSYSRDAQVDADTSEINMAWQRRGAACNSEQAILLRSVSPHPALPTSFSVSPSWWEPTGASAVPQLGRSVVPGRQCCGAFYLRRTLCRLARRELGRTYFLTNSPTPRVFTFFFNL